MKRFDFTSVCPSSASVFSVRGNLFQLGSDTTQFISFSPEFGLQVLPVIAGLRVIVLAVQRPDNIQNGEPPLRGSIVPDGADFAVIEEPDGDFLHR